MRKKLSLIYHQQTGMSEGGSALRLVAWGG